MAELRTLKHGRLYLLKDGSYADDFAQAAISSGGFFEKSDGTWGVLMQEGDDLYQYDGAEPASIQAGTPSASLNAANTIARPTFYTGSDGRVHCWYGYDEGAGVNDLRYTYTDNDGTSWAAAVDLNIVGDQTWCDDDVFPVYFDLDGASAGLSILWCVGVNGSTYSLGKVFVVTAGTFNTQVASAANYTAFFSGVLDTGGTPSVTMTKHRGSYHLFRRNGSNGVRYFTSSDGDTWGPSVINLNLGASGSQDDAGSLPYSVVVHRGAFHLMYAGSDGTNITARLAIGEEPDGLVKVPWMDVDTFGSADLLTTYSGDLTFAAQDQAMHTMDRGDFGAITEAPYEPQPISFTVRHVGELDATDGQLGWLLGQATGNVGDDAVVTNTRELGRLNVAYVLEDDAGTPTEYFLFPHVIPDNVSLAEGADGNVITLTGMYHNVSRPLWGRIV